MIVGVKFRDGDLQPRCGGEPKIHSEGALVPRQNLGPRADDELKSLAALRSISLGCRLVPDVVTQLLFQPAGCSRQRRKPVRLFGLRFCSHAKPRAKETAPFLALGLCGTLPGSVPSKSRSILAGLVFCCRRGVAGFHFFRLMLVWPRLCWKKESGAGHTDHS
jgi:hypothetical protein